MTLPSTFPPPLPHGVDEHVLFRTLFMASPDAIIVAGLDGGIVLANSAAATLLVYSLEDLTRLNVDDLVPEAIRPKHAAYRHSYEQKSKARTHGHANGVGGQAWRWFGGDGRDRLEPLAKQGLAVCRCGHSRHRHLPSHEAGSAPGPLQRSLGAVGAHSARWRDTQALLDQIPVSAIQALQLDAAALYLRTPTGWRFAWQPERGRAPPANVSAKRCSINLTPLQDSC
jgi:hypothetical protein